MTISGRLRSHQRVRILSEGELSLWLLRGREQKLEAECLIRLGLEESPSKVSGRSLHNMHIWRCPAAPLTQEHFLDLMCCLSLFPNLTFKVELES